MLQGLFLCVDVEGGRSRGIGLVKEERSYLTRKLLPGVWARQGIVSLPEVQVRSGAELSGGPLSSSLKAVGAGQGLPKPVRQQLDPQVHPRDWAAFFRIIPALFHPLPPTSPTLGADTLDRPLAISAHLRPDQSDRTVGPVNQLLGHPIQEVRVTLALCQKHF